MNFSIQMDPDTVNQLNELAKRTGNSRNALIKTAVKELLVKQSKSEWPASVKRHLGGKKALKNMPAFEAFRKEISKLRDVKL